uniref:Rieske domain-containing protein n=1 Tax=Chromera velia CCMP2878 TaxID=1169474 RepID=A0A0G4F7V5_9ALVE|eukprot:Cvel_15466.t1-p1 / transcript=Cvel_15466.t1 / gene=Cvel_15466 / organism=Chromera_velia_CCMP2878 / gene_product=hypothetical protein / transcript_product=hypothetical protein / location=Cvel_scaffold1146:11248-12862(-) / protein_length=195 / sequence_SO=supercontig / SO=protein_coding / is_pseudo=false
MKLLFCVLSAVVLPAQAFVVSPFSLASRGRRAVESTQLNALKAATAKTGNRVWKSAIKVTEIAPGAVIPVNVGGLNVLIIADEDGTISACANSCPHLNTPLEQATIEEGKIICGLHQTAFNLETGEVVGKWCPSPPVVGPVTGLLKPPRPLKTFPVRQVGDDLQVLVRNQARPSYEQKYWKGLLDAQGKDDGTYY